MAENYDKNKPVKRYDLRQAQSFLLTNPKIALILAIVFDVIAVALFLNMIAHPSTTHNAYMKVRIAIGFTLGASMVFFYYAGKGFSLRGRSPSN